MFRKIILLFILIIINNQTIADVLVDTIWTAKNSCKIGIKVMEVGVSKKSYTNQRIPCAIYTDFYKDGWRENNDIAMIMPSKSKLSKLIGKLGINNSDYVILYTSGKSKYSMAELTAIYFTFKYLGHVKISIMDGGMKKYVNSWDHDVDSGEILTDVAEYIPKLDSSILAKANYIEEHFDEGLLYDSRETDYFLGINKLDKFPFYGTIPNSKNLPSKWLLNNRGLSFNNIELIDEIFRSFKIKKTSKPVFFCYSGLESSLNWFVAHELMGIDDAKLYEGSIFDWVSQNKVDLYRQFNED